MPMRYSPQDIDRGLTALALTGNSHKAAAMTGLGDRTIRLWKQRHPERYEDIATRRAALIDSACISEFREIVLDATSATRRAVELTHSQLEHDEQLPKRRQQLLNDLAGCEDAAERAVLIAALQSLTPRVKDASASAKNLATTAAIASDKIALMEGRPTSIVEYRSADDVLKAMDGKGFVDSTAHEAPEAESGIGSDIALLPESAPDNAREPANTGAQPV